MFRHLGMGVEQKRHETRFAEILPFCDLLEGRRIGVGLALIARDHMARRAPPLRQPLAVEGVSRKDGLHRTGYGNHHAATHLQSLFQTHLSPPMGRKSRSRSDATGASVALSS